MTEEELCLSCRYLFSLVAPLIAEGVGSKDGDIVPWGVSEDGYAMILAKMMDAEILAKQ